jgi:protein SHQ1
LFPAIEEDWQLPQTLNDDCGLKISNTYPYGFLDLYSGYLKHIHLTENEINELGEAAETSSHSERRKAREAHEDKKFDEEHYLYVFYKRGHLAHLHSRADYMDDETILELTKWAHPYYKADQQELTEAENLMLLRLPRKECMYHNTTILYFPQFIYRLNLRNLVKATVLESCQHFICIWL